MFRIHDCVANSHVNQDDREDEDTEDARTQQQNLDNYVLVRDRAKRTITIRAMYRDEEGIEGVQKPRVILSLSTCEDYELEQLDVKNAFLHDDMLIGFKIKSAIEYTKGLQQKKFDMKTLVQLGKYLVWRLPRDKSVFVPFGAHFKVSLKDYSSSDWDVERMSKVSYVNVVAHGESREEPLESNEVDFERETDGWLSPRLTPLNNLYDHNWKMGDEHAMDSKIFAALREMDGWLSPRITSLSNLYDRNWKTGVEHAMDTKN
ncbi:hypothetical protein Tco_0997770 [Tanacetum coccineum]